MDMDTVWKLSKVSSFLKHPARMVPHFYCRHGTRTRLPMTTTGKPPRKRRNCMKDLAWSPTFGLNERTQERSGVYE